MTFLYTIVILMSLVGFCSSINRAALAFKDKQERLISALYILAAIPYASYMVFVSIKLLKG